MKFKYIFAGLLFAAAAISLPHFSSAQSVPGTDRMLMGWAWSSNIGWVSFNCANPVPGSPSGTCDIEKYKVKLLADNTLSGYAWSSNIGWVQFGGLSGFPSGSGTSNVNAVANTLGTTFSGWARALATGGGWDGWISMSGNTISSPLNYHNSSIATTPAAGTQGSYSVTVSGNNLLSYAWGSDVMGWLSFAGPGYGVVIVPNDPTTDPGNPGGGAGSCTDPISGLTIHNGSSTPSEYDTNTCSNVTRLCTNGVLSPGNTTNQCATNPTGGDTTTAPQLKLSLQQGSNAPTHGPLTLSTGSLPVTIKWDTSGGGLPTSCVGSASLTNLGDLSDKTFNVSGGNLGLGALSASKTYTMTCTNPAGASTDTVKVIIFAIKEF